MSEFDDIVGRPSSALDGGFQPSRIAYIRTSDRSTFRRCRRKFNWSYLHRGNRTGREAKAPLWLGTGFHYAMEDFHGHKHHKSAAEALRSYAFATKKSKGVGVPTDWEELVDQGSGMLDYYQEWLRTRDGLSTLWVDGIPQVEVRFQVPVDIDPVFLARVGFDACVYTGTIDRVCIDEFGRIWPLDYKTAKAIQTGHLETDAQVTAYCWAVQQIYSLPVAGFIYQQHKKQVPHEPAFLKGTGAFSVAKNQVTTYALYAKALRNLYGSVEKAPGLNIQFLNNLAAEESDRADKLISREFVERNRHQIDSELAKIQAEVMEMLDPNLALYPNPTRDCSWDCDFKVACLSLDDGSDWNYEIETNTADREDLIESWRSNLQYNQIQLF